MKNMITDIVVSATNREIAVRALKVCVVVGTVLNLINQGDKIIWMVFGEINYVKMILTYLVPYAVSTHTALCMTKGTNSISN